jgi:hypothetical protein
MTTPNTTANISSLPSGDYIFRVAGLNSVGQGAYNTLYSAMPVPDPYFSSVVLLLHGDSNFIDSSSYNRTLTINGEVTANGSPKYGNYSLNFDGNGDYLTLSSSNELVLETSDFTIEAWIYPRSWNNSNALIIGSNTNNSVQISRYGTSSTQFGLALSGVSWLISDANLPAINVWTHIAIIRASGVIKIYINGVQSGSSYTGTANFSSPIYAIGGNGSNDFDGLIDELRITRGVARYTSNFTPSPVPFPVSPIITISSQPTNQLASSGNASFSVTASVTLGATLSYQWQKQTNNVPFTDISGANNSSLSLTNLTESNNNELYRCIIRSTGGVGLISNTATLTVGSFMAEYLLVGGGGAGAKGTPAVCYGGGGGGGGILSGSVLVSSSQTYTIVVGTGGVGSSNISTTANGNNTTAFGLTAGGGQGGGENNPRAGHGGNSGSPQSIAGSSGSINPSRGGSGSGGSTGNINGGSGIASSITGSSIIYGGGGGGGGDGVKGLGGAGGGGDGAGNGETPQSGVAGTGGGGGGMRGDDSPVSGSGGSGIVIIRVPQTAASTTGSPTVTTVGSDTVYTFTSSGSITF